MPTAGLGAGGEGCVSAETLSRGLEPEDAHETLAVAVLILVLVIAASLFPAGVLRLTPVHNPLKQ